MKKHLTVWTLTALALFVSVTALESRAQQTAQASTPARVVGEVTAIDAAAHQVTIKTDDGRSVVISTGERTAVLRLPPGETTADKATRITLSDIGVGDKLFARGDAGASADAGSLTARQVVVTSARTGAQSAGREEWRRRGLNGRITALNPQTKEITVMTRSREGVSSITIAAGGNVRFLRFAPDSSKLSDATPSSFADLKVGDQVRALGERSADGLRFTPEEIISGSLVRAGGTVTAVNAAANEVTIKNSQTGQSMTLTIGARSSLRRIPPETAAALAQRRVRGEGGGDGAGGNGPRSNGSANNNAVNNGPTNNGPANGAANNGPAGDRGRGGRGEGGRGERGGGGPGGGRNFQEMMDSLPVITLADLKKGDAVFVVGTPGSNASRATAVTLITGDAEFMNRLQQLQGRPGRDGQNSNPGLPGDVMGGGAPAGREQPQQP